MRAQCLREEQVTLVGFFRGYTIERLVHTASSVRQFVAKGGPHLQDGVRETKLKNRTRDRGIGALIPKIDLLPSLYSS